MFEKRHSIFSMDEKWGAKYSHGLMFSFNAFFCLRIMRLRLGALVWSESSGSLGSDTGHSLFIESEKMLVLRLSVYQFLSCISFGDSYDAY